MRHGIRFNPFASSPGAIAAEMAELRARAPGLDTLVRLDTVGRPGELDLEPTLAQLDSVESYLDAAEYLGFAVWLNLYDYRALNHQETNRSVGGLNQGEPIPWDPPRTMPWSLPPVPVANRAAVRAFLAAYLGRVGSHPALGAFILRGAGHTAFGAEWQGADSYAERAALTEFAAYLVPEIRNLVGPGVDVGIHVQPSFWQGAAGVAGAAYWMRQAVTRPELAGAVVDVSAKRLVSAAAILDAASTEGLPAGRVCISDFGLYHAQTPTITDPLGHLMREVGEARRRGAFAAWYWQYRPEGYATTYTFRGPTGEWDDAVVGLWSGSGNDFQPVTPPWKE